MERRLHEVQEVSLRLAAAEKVVIVGGGTVGVELAAEIVGKWKKQKHVILITSHPSLLERMPKKAQQYAQQWMERQGVEVVFEQRVVEWGALLRTAAGLEFRADVYYKCIGFQPSSHFFTPTQPTPTPIPVDPITLQVTGYETVFACGDCTNTQEEKTAFAADLSAQLAAKNIIRHFKKESLLHYPQDVCQGREAVPEIACVSLYKHDGILQINERVITGTAAALAKSQIEFLQLAVAQERGWAKFLWNFMELANLWISQFL